MSRRKAITERMKIDALFHGYLIYCGICSVEFEPGDKIEWDHNHALALAGDHSYKNLWPVRVLCHKRKTFGTKATTAGSDIHKISKERRIIRTQKFVVNRDNRKAEKPKRKWAKRSFPKSKRKLRRAA